MIRRNTFDDPLGFRPKRPKRNRSHRMLNEAEVNAILGPLLFTFEEKVPSLRPMTIDVPQGMNHGGTYGSVVLGTLLCGNLDGKITLTLEWVTALAIAEELTHSHVEEFHEAAQRALEGVFYEAAQGIATSLVKLGREVELYPLPTLVDTNVLLAEDSSIRTLSIGLLTKASGTMNLYLAFRSMKKKRRK